MITIMMKAISQERKRDKGRVKDGTHWTKLLLRVLHLLVRVEELGGSSEWSTWQGQAAIIAVNAMSSLCRC